MEIKKTEKRTTEIITDILCDSCGNSCKVSETIIDNEIRLDNGERIPEFEFMELRVNWGFHSKNKDLQLWTAHICENCVEQKLSFINFKKTELNLSLIK